MVIIILKGPLMSDEQERDIFGNLPSEQAPRRKKAESKQVFKRYDQHQIMMLPPSLEELIPEKHVVRVVNRIIDGLNLDVLISTYEGGGTSAYHPVMLLKVLIYAYVSKVYASRLIAKALRENVHFMWLSGMNRPDFRTINEFRSGRLKRVIDEVFSSTVVFLIDKKYVDLSEYFVDGTKLPADANRHKVVWAKNTKRYKEIVQQKIKAQLHYIDQVNTEENEQYGDRDLQELGQESQLSSEEVKHHVTKLNSALQTSQRTTSDPQQGETSSAMPRTPEKTITRTINEIETKLLPKLEKYEEQEKVLAGRNSCSRTDTDATAFRMKNGQILPGYNILLGTQRQFILNYTLHQRKASESDALIAHMHHGQKTVRRYPEAVVGDSAFGSEENYAFLSQHGIGNYLKFNTFHFERTKRYRTDLYRRENFLYDDVTDRYTCPQGRRLELKQDRRITTDHGYVISTKMYQSVDCSGCPVAGVCKRGSGNRTITINRTLDAYRAQARANLTSERGIALRKQRGSDVEPAIGDIKFNQGYNRCRLRGQAKVRVDIGLLSIAHNTKKISQLSIN